MWFYCDPQKSQTDTTLRVFRAIPAVVAGRKRLHFFWRGGGGARGWCKLDLSFIFHQKVIRNGMGK